MQLTQRGPWTLPLLTSPRTVGAAGKRCTLGHASCCAHVKQQRELAVCGADAVLPASRHYQSHTARLAAPSSSLLWSK